MKVGRCARGIEFAHWTALFSAATCLLLLLWLPIVLIQLSDSLSLFKTPAEIADLAALSAWLLTLLCAFVAAVACTLGTLISVVSTKAGTAISWMVTLLPVGFAVAWKVSGAAKAWMQAVTGQTWDLTGGQKGLAIAVVAAVIVAAIWLWRRRSPRAFREQAVRTLVSAFPLAIGLLVVAAAWLIWRPPSVHWASDEEPFAASTFDKKPDIILISIDTLAAADADLCGTNNAFMPNLQRFLRASTCFSQFYASSNYTLPTTVTIETGMLPWSHWSAGFNARLPPSLRGHSMAASLRTAGYDTHSVSANQWASPRHHGTWKAYKTHAIPSSNSWSYTLSARLTDLFPEADLSLIAGAMFPFLLEWDIRYRGHDNPWDSDLLYRRATAVLQGHKSAPPRPLFLWVHTMLPHSPYLPPASTRHRLLPPGQLEAWADLLADNIEYDPSKQPLVDAHRLRYRESIMAADEALGRFFDQLTALGRFDSSVIVVTADHGESFEKGYMGHAGVHLHNALIRIPLLIKLPGQQQARVLSQAFSQADLAPTLLDLANADPLPAADGRSLTRTLQGMPIPPRAVFSMSMEREGRFRPLSRGTYTMIDGPLKLTLDVASGTSTLHDLGRDPNELVDLSPQRGDDAERMQRELRKQLSEAEAKRKQLDR